MPELNAESLIQDLKLQPHPEGGFYRETYRSHDTCLNGTRNMTTAIYFLLFAGHVSKFHRIKSDEMWHFYMGEPLVVAQITSEGKLVQTILGNNFAQGQVLQHVVPAGDWFGSYPASERGFSLVGCTVSPGFDFEDFEMAQQQSLLAEYPNLTEIIIKLS